MDIVSRLKERVPSVTFIDMTRLVEEDTKTVVLRSHAFTAPWDFTTLREFHQQSRLKKLIDKAHESDNVAFLIRNSKLIRHHPTWFSCVDERKAFDSGVPWCLLHRDNSFMPNANMDPAKAIETAVDVLFHNEICCICLEPVNSATSTLLVPCNHVVHVECMNTWRRSGSGRCPLCRA